MNGWYTVAGLSSSSDRDFRTPGRKDPTQFRLLGHREPDEAGRAAAFKISGHVDS